ncbi:MAG: type II CAAX endopeptidase family protein [Chloroflexota bacterium]
MTKIIEGKRPGPARAVGFGYSQVAFLVIIMMAITVCEYVFAYQDVAYGIMIALGLTLAIYVILSVLRLDQRIVDCAESLTLIPLYILFTSSLPWFFFNQQYLLPAVYSCILALCLWHIYRKNLSIKSLFGFKRKVDLKWATIGALIAIPTGTIEYLILRPAPTFPTFEVQYLLRDLAYMLFFVGLAEEVLFRAFIQKDLEAAFGWKWALFFASALFAVMHLTWRSMMELGFVFFAGMIMGGLYLKTRSLTAPIILHAVNNVMLVAVCPYIFRL